MIDDDRLAAAARVAERHVRWVERAVWVVLVAGILGFVARGADRPPDPYLTRPAEAAVERQPLEGFGEVAIRITDPAGRAARLCALLAETQAARQRGLMEQTSLRGYDGMLFTFEEPSDTPFYMYNTVMPLSLAYFAGDGSFVSSVAMDPCPGDDPAACPRYPPEAPYRYALEVPRGTLGRVGALPGSMLSFPSGGCV